MLILFAVVVIVAPWAGSIGDVILMIIRAGFIWIVPGRRAFRMKAWTFEDDSFMLSVTPRTAATWSWMWRYLRRLVTVHMRSIPPG
jgi:hypothetical protein